MFEFQAQQNMQHAFLSWAKVNPPHTQSYWVEMIPSMDSWRDGQIDGQMDGQGETNKLLLYSVQLWTW